MEPAPAADPIALLRGINDHLTPKLHGEILALGPDAVSPLIQVLQDPESGRDAAVGECRPPAHAVDLLVDLNAIDAIGPLLQTLVSAGVNEALHSRIVSRLPELGAPVLEPALQLMNGGKLDQNAVDALCSVLSKLGVRDERIFEQLCQYFDERPGPGALCFAHYGDARALHLVALAIEGYQPDWNSAAWDWELNELIGGYEQLAGALPPWLTRHVATLRAEWAERTKSASGNAH